MMTPESENPKISRRPVREILFERREEQKWRDFSQLLRKEGFSDLGHPVPKDLVEELRDKTRRAYDTFYAASQIEWREFSYDFSGFASSYPSLTRLLRSTRCYLRFAGQRSTFLDEPSMILLDDVNKLLMLDGNRVEFFASDMSGGATFDLEELDSNGNQFHLTVWGPRFIEAFRCDEAEDVSAQQ